MFLSMLFFLAVPDVKRNLTLGSGWKINFCHGVMACCEILILFLIFSCVSGKKKGLVGWLVFLNVDFFLLSSWIFIKHQLNFVIIKKLIRYHLASVVSGSNLAANG
jgi:hypothetical protein